MSRHRRRIDLDSDQQNSSKTSRISRRSYHDGDGDSSAPSSLYYYSSNESLQQNIQTDINRPASPSPSSSPSPSPQPTTRRDNHRKCREIQTAKTMAFREANFRRFCCIIASILGIFILLWFTVFTWNANQIKTCSFEQLATKYPQQNMKIWEKVRNSIENVMNKRVESPAVLLFTHQGSGNMLPIIYDILQNARDCLREREIYKLPLDLFTSKETASDYGNVIAYYNKKINKGKVVIVANLNEIPAQAALALHPICDTYMKVSHETMIFMTLVTPTTSDTPRNIAFDTLRRLWNELKNDDLMPLLARITDDVIQLDNFEI